MKGKGTKKNDARYLQDAFRKIEIVCVCVREGEASGGQSVRDGMLAMLCADDDGAA